MDGIDETEEPRVVIVDDHEVVRKGVELVLRSAGMAVIGVAGTVGEGRAIIGRRRPHVALIDIRLPDGSGVDLARALAADAPASGVFLYTGEVDSELMRDGLSSGARGFALKAGSPKELVEGVRRVARGGTYFDPRLAAATEERSRAQHNLSPREREVLALLARGHTGEDVAAELVLSPETIRTHVRNAMTKLGAKTRVHALALALKSGEIDL